MNSNPSRGTINKFPYRVQALVNENAVIDSFFRVYSHAEKYYEVMVSCGMYDYVCLDEFRGVAYCGIREWIKDEA